MTFSPFSGRAPLRAPSALIVPGERPLSRLAALACVELGLENVVRRVLVFSLFCFGGGAELHPGPLGIVLPAFSACAADTAARSAASLPASPLCPRTQSIVVSKERSRSAASICFTILRFATGWPETVRQPALFQLVSHLFVRFTTYCESEATRRGRCLGTCFNAINKAINSAC